MRYREGDKIHEVGDCVDPAYGGDWCDGILRLGEDPFASEMTGEYIECLMCDGERSGSAADI